MQFETNIAKVLEETGDKARYDYEIKKVLSDPQILSWILKGTVQEFKDSTIPEIMKCIVGKPEVAEHPLQPGHYMEPVEGLANESAEPGTNRVTYDIRVRVRLPHSGVAGMIINVEAQNKFYETYDLASRGIFYCARLLSTQVRSAESAEVYNSLEKVYSIWIYLDVPMTSEYTITRYHIVQDDVYGHRKDSVNNHYDLMEMVMVCLGKPEHAERGTDLHRLLNTVLSEELKPEEKKRKLQEEFDMVTSVELEGGLAAMCNLSEHIEERGVQKGLEQGIEKGIEQGIEKGIELGEQRGMLQTLFSLIEDRVLPLETAAQKAGFTVEEFEMQYQEYRKDKHMV